MSSWNRILADSEWDGDFSPRNLPYGVCTMLNGDVGEPFLATRVGGFVLKLVNFAPELPIPPQAGDWQFLMRQTKTQRVQFRETLQQLVLSGQSRLHLHEFFTQTCFPAGQIRCQLPCVIGDYTDFYASRNHAENVGIMYRGKDAALQPNWLHLPVGYHGRASSVVCSPSSVVRPMGQLPSPGGKPPVSFAKTSKLDFELEVGVFVGGPENELGTRLTVAQARDRIFGLVLLNDWSARDIQTWEYVPLGPFTAKNFCTTISPWIVPVEALDSCKAIPVGGITQPDLIDYLRDDEYLLYDVDLFAAIKSNHHKELVVCQTNLRNLYWTPAQMMAHHTVTGCNLRPGDLLGTGTISGPQPNEFGSLLEASWNGTKSMAGRDQAFLQDGDVVRMFGRAKGLGVGFGDCVGVVLPSKL
ncbi:fumarylacetoacetase [Batrachochytrium salamandrivorans]|nr:fumarylacetoacetase [Batrachochytrium salamandrivorans]